MATWSAARVSVSMKATPSKKAGSRCDRHHFEGAAEDGRRVRRGARHHGEAEPDSHGSPTFEGHKSLKRGGACRRRLDALGLQRGRRTAWVDDIAFAARHSLEARMRMVLAVVMALLAAPLALSA